MNNLFQKTKDNFCAIPWTSIEVNNLGYFRVCCISNNHAENSGLFKDEQGQWYNVLTHDIKDVLNSPHHRAIRATHASGEYHPNCNTCWERDRATKITPSTSTGRRLFFSVGELNRSVISPFPQYEETIANPDLWKQGITSLDLKLGNLCNSACVQCDPKNSNQMIEEYVEFHGTTVIEDDPGAPEGNHFILKPNGRYELAGADWFETDTWWQQFTSIAGQLKHVYVTGGEPMVVPFHGRMLDYFIEHDLAKNITIEYDSNLTAINRRLVEKFSQFRKVFIRASMDGLEDTYEYIRYPSKWSVFSGNVDNNLGIIKAVTCCLMPYNAWQLPEIEAWVKQRRVNFTLRFIMTPGRLALANFPKEMKDSLIEFYSQYLPRAREYPETIKALNYLKDCYDKHDPREVRRFLNYSNFLTKKRNKDWKVLFPQLAKFFVDHPNYTTP